VSASTALISLTDPVKSRAAPPDPVAMPVGIEPSSSNSI
jgi:hypothetical protein